MNEFWKAAGLILLTVVLDLTISKTGKDFSVLLSMMVCCIVGATAISYLSPVIAFLEELNTLAQLKNGVLQNLLKSAGIALVAEMAGLICADAGNSSLGKAFQLLGTAAVLYLSIPVFNSLITLIQDILGR